MQRSIEVPSPRRARAFQKSTMDLRNVAIIAHVDHGKTTLVDRLLQQSGTYRDNQRQVERAMDSNDLERERGITILAKATSILWQGHRINIVDTPGHADFGGEVERILNMVDGALVLVDAAEGPLPQTKFVVSKALRMGLKPIVVINKVDRPDARPIEVVNEVFDLFAALDATDEQLDFPILYGSAKQGWMATSLEGSHDDGMTPLFDLILNHVKPPVVEEGPFRLLGTILEANPYLGRVITGRITSGSVKPNQNAKVLDHDRQARRERPHHQGAGVPRARARPGGRGRGRRHRRDRGPAECDGRAHDLRARGRDADPGAADRSADARHDVPGERLAARRHRGRQGHGPHDPRPAAARGRRQRGAARARIRRKRLDGSRGPRRIAARHPDRDHAARGLRAVGVAAESAAAPERGGRTRRAARRGRDRRRRGAFRRRRAEDVGAQGRADRDAAVRRASHAARVLRADARPDRLPGRAAHRYARHRDHEPPVPWLYAAQGRDRGPPQRRAHLQRIRARRSPTRCGSWRTAGR